MMNDNHDGLGLLLLCQQSISIQRVINTAGIISSCHQEKRMWVIWEVLKLLGGCKHVADDDSWQRVKQSLSMLKGDKGTGKRERFIIIILLYYYIIISQFSTFHEIDTL